MSQYESVPVCKSYAILLRMNLIFERDLIELPLK